MGGILLDCHCDAEHSEGEAIHITTAKAHRLLRDKPSQ
jgi:hypothetical protein